MSVGGAGMGGGGVGPGHSMVINASVPDPKPMLTLHSILVYDDHLPKFVSKQNIKRCNLQGERLSIPSLCWPYTVSRMILQLARPISRMVNILPAWAWTLHVCQEMCKLKNSVEDVDDKN
eukprot:505624-Ditylum_brightwellii.AAC.2